MLPNKIILVGSDFGSYKIEGEEDNNKFGKLEKVNIFVGENNSGKSRFLRSILKSEPLIIGSEIHDSVVQLHRKFQADYRTLMATYQCAEVREWTDTINKLEDVSVAREQVQISTSLRSALKMIGKTESASFRPHQFNYSYSGVDILKGFKKLASEAEKELDKILIKENFVSKRYYVPILRGLRPIGSPGSDPYCDATLQAYGKSSDVNIFTGQNLYTELKRLLLGDLAERRIVADFQNFVGEVFFEGRPVALIPKYNSEGIIDVKIGDEKEYPIHHLGDGIQSIIIIAFIMFRNRDINLMLGIEEPDLFLHPGLQRMLMKLFVSEKFPNHQIFFTTHSNHMLDVTLSSEYSISIFSFQKSLQVGESPEHEAKFNVFNVSNEDSRPLGILGVNNSSVFLSNCTIWVEGITDRRYISRFLSLYTEELRSEAGKNGGDLPRVYKENLHYSFVEYAGANITHWSFLDSIEDAIIVERLCSKLFLIVDRDTETGKKVQRRQELQDKLGERFYCLMAKEIENVLSLDTIKKVVSFYERGDSDFTDTKADHSNVPLGSFIEKKLLKEKKRSGSYQDGNTISDKLKFCDIALKNLNSIDDMTDEAKALSEKLYKFISDNNN
ncbi:AAA family ATPase [Luteolibacter sp. SL250]|uniref:AAA family ATPase n=1 Tax=Luteolibacter sp. SL250 TaxID=2995170 RepID=UPI00226EF41C|nr:AAA family ATPase [Luteolibacter sp. SL250]WAC20287.1 AAA family ATPase [Luteolibacter sp. SL250]